MPIRSAVLALALAGALPASAAQGKSKLEFAYVVLGAQGAVARAVYTDATTCPSVALASRSGKTTQPMSVRALPQSADPSGKKPAFPVLVCELLIPAGTTGAAIGKSKLPLPPDTLAAVAVIGDTGCRLKADKDADHDDDGKFQDCDSKSAWPFSTLARNVARRKPQLLVHVGDYIYRESPCPKGQTGCKGSPYGDNWDTWKADFFKPAAPLLAAAPWIATRGNHEICARAGDGFMLFLDPRLATDQKPPACVALLDPLTVTVDGQQFIMLDSSNAPDECPDSGCDTTTSNAPECPKPGCSAKAYADQFAALQPANGAWLVSHRPVWGFKNKEPAECNAAGRARPMERQAAARLHARGRRPHPHLGNAEFCGRALTAIRHRQWRHVARARHQGQAQRQENQRNDGERQQIREQMGLHDLHAEEEESRDVDRDLLLDPGQRQVRLQRHADRSVVPMKRERADARKPQRDRGSPRWCGGDPHLAPDAPKAEVVKIVKPGEDIVTGLRVLDTAGHTPGHISLEPAGGDGLIVVGDAVPHATVTFAHPEWRFGFDAIADLAIANRCKRFDRAATEKVKLIGCHWPHPGVGFAERRDRAYRYVPA